MAAQGRRAQVPGEREKKGVLSDFSMTTVIASALAAVTSLVLSSRIGLAGSLIGTAIAAAASSVATQVYKGVLLRSADKLKEIAPLPETNAEAPEAHPGAVSTGGLTRDLSPEATMPATTMPATTISDATMPETISDKTSPRLMVAATGTPVAPARMRAVAAERLAREQQRRLTLFASVVAVVVALVAAGLIVWVTRGHGIGGAEDAETYYEEGWDEEAYSEDASMVAPADPSAGVTSDTSSQDSSSTASPESVASDAGQASSSAESGQADGSSTAAGATTAASAATASEGAPADNVQGTDGTMTANAATTANDAAATPSAGDATGTPSAGDAS